MSVSERERERERERAGPGRRATKEKEERKTEQRHKWHSWQGFCSRPIFLFWGFLHLFRRHGYTPQMKVRLSGENNCRGLLTSSPLRVCVCLRSGASLRGPLLRVRGVSDFCGFFFFLREPNWTEKRRSKCALAVLLSGSGLDRARCREPTNRNTCSPDTC